MSEHDLAAAPPELPPSRRWEGEVELRVRAYRFGDEREEHGTWLVQKLAPAIESVFRNQGFRPERAAELTQDTLLRVFQKIEEYRFEAPFSAWVRRIAVNLLRNTRRDEMTRRQHFREESLDARIEAGASGHLELGYPNPRRERDSESHALASELREVLGAALSELPPKMRRSVQLFALGFTYQEISDAMGVSLNTVRSQISNGYRRLRPLVERYLGGTATIPRRKEGRNGD